MDEAHAEQSVAPQEVAGAADCHFGSREASSTTALFYSCIDKHRLSADSSPAANHGCPPAWLLPSRFGRHLFTPESLAESVI